MNKFFTIIGICCILPIILIGIIWFASDRSAQQAGPASSENLELQGEEISIEGSAHVSEGTDVTYKNSNPPTSGDHWPSPANLGLYNEPLPDEQLVHNLEHGAIWVSYKDSEMMDAETGKKFEALVDTYPQAVIITKRPENEAQFAIASWGRLYTSDTFDQEFADKFIRANINNSPEPLASLEQAPGGAVVHVGASFPEFEVVEVDGRVITNESLKGKPSIIWFTTEFCIPCQIGARVVSGLDDELGGGAFNVLVVFVDPRETEDKLKSWRERFGRSDWLIAFDNFGDGSNSLSGTVGVQYLDSKYLLDDDGIIQNIDFQIANEAYLDVIRSAVNQ